MVNQVILVGRLTADPEVRATQSGTFVANLRIATTSHGRDEAGGRSERTEYHSAVAFGRLAEIAGEYLRKGRMIYLDGRLQTRSWQPPEAGAQKRYFTEVIVENLVMLGSRHEAEAGPEAPARLAG